MMHWQTYWRLVACWEAAEARANLLFAGTVFRRFGRFIRVA